MDDPGAPFKKLNDIVDSLMKEMNNPPQGSVTLGINQSNSKIVLTPNSTGGTVEELTAENKIKRDYPLFIKIAYLLFRIINSFILNYFSENETEIRNIFKKEESVLLQNKTFLEKLYKDFNITKISDDNFNTFYENIETILIKFNTNLEKIRKMVKEIEIAEEYYLSGDGAGTVVKPLEGNVKTIIKLRRALDDEDLETMLQEKKSTSDSDYLFKLGRPEVKNKEDTIMKHRYLEYINTPNRILISGHIFSDITHSGKQGTGWSDDQYKEFRNKMFPESDSSDLIITLGLTDSGKSWVSEKTRLLTKEQENYEFNFNEEGGKWVSLTIFKDRATYSTYLNPQSSRSHLLQINKNKTMVDLAGAENSFTFTEHIDKITPHIDSLLKEYKKNYNLETGEDEIKKQLYVKYYLQGHSGLLIREAFNRFEQIKNYWGGENMNMYEDFVKSLELYTDIFKIYSKKMTPEEIFLEEINKFSLDKFKEYIAEKNNLQFYDKVKNIDLIKEIEYILQKIEKNTDKMDKQWWEEGPTITSFNENIEYPIITNEDEKEMTENFKWYNSTSKKETYYKKLFMYFYLRKLYGIDADEMYKKYGGFYGASKAPSKTFLLKISNKVDADYLKEIFDGTNLNDDDIPKTIFDILKTVPNLKTEEEGGDGGDEEEKEKWTKYFTGLRIANEEKEYESAVEYILKESIKYNSILGRIIRTHTKIKSGEMEETENNNESIKSENNQIIKKLTHCYLLLVNYFNRIYEGYMINKTLKELEIRTKAKNRKPKLPFGYEKKQSSLVELFCYNYLNPENLQKDLIQSAFLDTKNKVVQVLEGSAVGNMKKTLGEFLDDPKTQLSIILAINTNKSKEENEKLKDELFYNYTIYNGIRYQLELYKTREPNKHIYGITRNTIRSIFEQIMGESMEASVRISQIRSTSDAEIDEAEIELLQKIDTDNKNGRESMELSPMELTNVLSTGLLKPYTLKESYFYEYFEKHIENFVPGHTVRGIDGGRSNKIINQNIRVNELSKLKKLYKELNKK